MRCIQINALYRIELSIRIYMKCVKMNQSVMYRNTNTYVKAMRKATRNLCLNVRRRDVGAVLGPGLRINMAIFQSILVNAGVK